MSEDSQERRATYPPVWGQAVSRYWLHCKPCEDPQYPAPKTREPEHAVLQEWEQQGGCQATDGCWVEPDGECEHGYPSWFVYLEMI